MVALLSAASGHRAGPAQPDRAKIGTVDSLTACPQSQHVRERSAFNRIGNSGAQFRRRMRSRLLECHRLGQVTRMVDIYSHLR